MYDIRQFKPTLYLLVVLGITGFAVAAEEPSLWVLASAAVMLNIWLVRSRKFSPIPRWVANGITVLAFVYVTHGDADPVDRPVPGAAANREIV